MNSKYYFFIATIDWVWSRVEVWERKFDISHEPSSKEINLQIYLASRGNCLPNNLRSAVDRWKCDLSSGNVHYGYPFNAQKPVCLPFSIRLSSVRDRWDAVRTNWIIRSEKFLVVWTAADIRSKKSSSVRTAEVTRSNKIFIRSNRWGYPFEKNLHPFQQQVIRSKKQKAAVRTADVIPLKKLR